MLSTAGISIAPLIFENTFASHVIYNPLYDSVSLVVHSLTKHIAGYGGVLGGAVVGGVEDIGDLGVECSTRRIKQAFDAYLALRGVRPT